MKLNNKGFTLIELLIVIAILAMLALFAAPNVVALINKNKVDNYNSTIDSIIEAAEVYVSNHRYDLNFNGNCLPTDTKEINTSIRLKDLIDSKDITNVSENPCNGERITSEEIKIKIYLNCKTQNFRYELIDDGSNFISDADSKMIKIEEDKTCDDYY